MNAEAVPGVPRSQDTSEREPPVVEMRGVTKRFGTVVANDNVSLSLRRGEVLAILGENGAGKTTLLNVLTGMVRPDTGEIRVDGVPVRIDSPEASLRFGIAAVYQHFTLVPTLSVIENVMLGTGTGLRLDPRAAEAWVRERLDDLGLGISPRALVRHLSVGQQQRVEIVKVLRRQPRVLLLDEPTSVLTPLEVEGLFSILRRLTGEGVTIVLITHKLEEALVVSDRIVVLRDGRVAGELVATDFQTDSRAARERVVTLMFGESPPESGARSGSVGAGAPRGGAVAVSLRSIVARDDRGMTALNGLSLDLYGGEIFGVAGVDGNGQKELAEVIAGQRSPVRGRVLVAGVDITGKGVRAAMRAGVGYVTDDRLGEGCVRDGSVALNAVLKRIERRPFSWRGLLDRAAIAREGERLIRKFDVRAPSAAVPIGQLSGGNIQKLLLARELAADPAVLVCNKPTSGLDVRTAQFVLDALRNHADAGNAVLLISSELEELLAVSDRIGVLFRGEFVGLFERGRFDPTEIGRLMLGAAGAPPGEFIARGAA